MLTSVASERAARWVEAPPGKTPFVAAVQTDWQGKPQRMALHKVSGFTNEQIEAFAKRKLKPNS